MTKTSIVAGITAVILGGVLFAPHAVVAYQGDPNVKGPNYTAERHDAMTKAFQTKDYNAWKNLMQGRGRVTQVVTAQNFSRFVDAHNLALQGKTAEANKIRAELGLGLHNGTGMGQGMGNGKTNR
jgi:hypothetical protein